MNKQNSRARWIEAGYDLFARQGLSEIKVERLAKDLEINKSSFYHFFGDLDHFFELLVQYHFECLEKYLADIDRCLKYDPDYLHVMIKYRQNIKMHWQLLRNRNIPGFLFIYESINDKVDQKLQPLWSAFIDMKNKPELAMKYYQFVRGRFYMIMDMDMMDYDQLHAVSTESREFIKAVMEKPDSKSNKKYHMD